MRVLVTGAYGLIGAAIAVRLHQDGHAVTGAGRSVAEAARRYPFVRWVTADFDRLTDSEAWRPLLAGIDAVVNCVGALQSGPRDDLHRVHVAAPLALFAACERFGPRRLVQISAIGADLGGATEFAQGKGEADAALAASSLDWLILRPGLVIAANVYGATAMLRGLAALPWVTPLVDPDCEVQIVAAEDVAATVAWALSPQPPAPAILEQVHPEKLTLGAIVAAQRRWLGLPPNRIVRMPAIAARAVSVFADALGYFGWRSPARSTASAQLSAGVTGDPGPWLVATGIVPRSHGDILAARPATLQDRWFARLYFIKPPAIAVLALFWTGTGLIALGPAYATALSHLAQAGVGPALAEIVTIGGALFDIALGLLLLVRRFTRAVLLVMLAASPLYLLAGTLLTPQLWGDPLGAYTKVIPLLLATVFTLAILDER